MISKRPVITICCITYNHESYIRDAIEGFLMQKTTFLFEVIIHDDASTDKTAEIVKEYADKYPNLFKTIFQTENKYSKGIPISATYVWPLAQGKYIAVCEGDDYWTDPYKLQKQVDFLESNEEFGLVYTEIDRLYEETKIVEKNAFKAKLGLHPNSYSDFLINAWFLAPCTWVYRRKFLAEYKQICSWVAGDYPLLLWISRQSKIHFLKDNTSVYRVLSQSASHHCSSIVSYQFRKGIFDIQNYYLNIDPISGELNNTIKAKFFIPYFKLICLIEDNEFKREAYTYIKEKEMLTLKIHILYQLLSNPVSLWVFKRISFFC